MKHSSLLALLLSLAAPLTFAASESVFLTSSQFTHHKERTQSNGKPWNEMNKGIGAEYRAQELPIAVGVGVYANSYFAETKYVGGRIDLVRSSYGDIGITAAYATGYAKPFVGGLTLTWPYAQIILAPAAPGSKNSSAFVNVQMRMPLF